MKCVLCDNGEAERGSTTVTLERDQLTLVFKSVPALICTNCGEAFVDQATTDQLLEALNEAVRAGVQVDVRRYITA